MTQGVSKVLSELDGGNFETRLAHVINEVSGAVLEHGGEEQVFVTLHIKKIKNSAQVSVDHTIKIGEQHD